MRLIDADALIHELNNSHYPGAPYVDAGVSIAIGKVLDAPTIEREPKWILCSEKMPEEDDYNSCIECLDGAVWYFTKNGTMGLGYYYESTKEWSTIYDLKTDGKVIAWMPLPESFREEGEK